LKRTIIGGEDDEEDINISAQLDELVVEETPQGIRDKLVAKANGKEMQRKSKT
jgi:hypothetical protein